MELAELIAYAKDTYGLDEQHKWADFSGFSVLCHPQTGKWIALLMRQWDGDAGREIACCDLKCGGGSLLLRRPYLSPPIRMRGNQWVGVVFGEETERETVLRLFDQAVAAGRPHGFTLVLDTPPAEESPWQETALPFARSDYRPEREAVPERLREMRRLYEYGRESPAARARNFYRQAVFMADYEDDVPWEGNFVCYYPTYHDLSIRQLRAYFTWRARLRRGDVRVIPASAAYLYIYELLNGAGVSGPEESLAKLAEFERVYLDSGIGDARMRSNLRRWMLELAVVSGLPPETARTCADPEMLAQDEALASLRAPEDRSDEAVFASLCRLGGKKTESSPVLARDPERGRRLFSQCWRRACEYRREGQALFALCFGERKARPWYPLSGAVYHEKARPADRDYALDDCRSYRCRAGVWETTAYDRLSFDRALLQGFLREADARLRRYLKTGRVLRENPADAWAIPYIDAAIEEDRRAALEAARPRIIIDLSGLEKIRRDALLTRESLLTEEERAAEREEAAPPDPAEDTGALPADPAYREILRALLAGEDASPLLRARHLMPSLVADAVNEAFFDEIGDTVLLCEGDTLLLVDDYKEELMQILGGTGDGGN